MDGLLNTFMGWLVDGVLVAFDAVASMIDHSLLLSADVTRVSQVQALAGRSILIVDSVFVLAFVAAGALTLVAGGDERARYTAKDLAPRLVVGFIAAHFSQLFCSQAVALANALTLAVTGEKSDTAGAVAAMKARVHTFADRQIVPLLFLTLLAIIVVLMASTTLTMVVRLCVLLVLTGAAPLALACHALPQTDPLARLWWRCFTGCLAVPILQAFTLQAGQLILLDPTHVLPPVDFHGMPGHPADVFNLFIVIVLLWTTVKIPGLVRRYAAQGGKSPNLLGMVVRVVLIQHVGKAVKIPGVSRGARAVAR
jgi:hypothetical protein